MSRFARVDSIEALRAFRIALCRFGEAVGNALVQSESEIQRTDLWLRQDRQPYWRAETRKRAEIANRARVALKIRQQQKSPLGGRPSCVEEEQAFAAAKRRLDEAETKQRNVQQWIRRLEEETFEFRGLVQGLRQEIETTLPKMLSRLDNMIASLESYAHVPSGSDPGTTRLPAGDAPDTMAREPMDADEQRAARSATDETAGSGPAAPVSSDSEAAEAESPEQAPADPPETESREQRETKD